MKSQNLSGQVGGPVDHAYHVAVLGEILWDLIDGSARLGGAPLNFAVHSMRLGHVSTLISALGEDELGSRARLAIESYGLNTRFVQTTPRFSTGTATVEFSPNGRKSFRIPRPAGFDALDLSDDEVRCVAACMPRWLYYGTLFMGTAQGMQTLHRLISALPMAKKFYDINLRPESYTPQLVLDLLGLADVVKLNEPEMECVADLAGLPIYSIEAFCRAGAARFGWRVACVTLGARGCAIWNGKDYAEAQGYEVEVADTVGAGDGFAAALLHGLARGWRPGDLGAFANRVGALIASRPGAIPDWDLNEVCGTIP